MTHDLDMAYILHVRTFRETSAIIDVFTQESGRVGLLVKGYKRNKRTKGIVQPFIPLWIGYRGKSDLKTVNAIEVRAKPLMLHHLALISGLYVNELLIRLLQRHDPHPALFDTYEHTLQNLEQCQEKSQIERQLRLFEKALLKELGFAVDFRIDGKTESPIEKEGFYQFYPQLGMVACSEHQRHAYQGQVLLALADDHYPNDEVLKEAKRLMRQALMVHLGEKPLYSWTNWSSSEVGTTPTSQVKAVEE